MRYGLLTGLIGAALVLASCGVRGDLELPPQRVAATDGAVAPVEAQPKPDRSFILDPLL